MPGKVLIDTNALMAAHSQGVDILGELESLDPGLEPVVPSGVVLELEAIARGGGGDEARSASVALELAEDLSTVESEGPVDDEIVRLAEERGFEVLTNDSKLIERLRRRGIPVIYIRQGSYLRRRVG